MNFGDTAGLDNVASELNDHAGRFGAAVRKGDATVAALFSHGDQPQLPSIGAFSRRWEDVRHLLNELSTAADRCSAILHALSHRLAGARSEWERAFSHALSIGALVIVEGTQVILTPPVDATHANVATYSSLRHQLQEACSDAHTAWSTANVQLEDVRTVHAGDLIRTSQTYGRVESGNANVNDQLRRLLPELMAAGMTAAAMR